MRYLWTEDTGAGLHFWKLVNQLFFDNELVVESKRSNQGLLDTLIDLETEDGDEYFVAFDYVVDNQDIRNKYRMLKSIADKSEGKIVILDIICFEYLILAFDKLVEWTGTGKTDKIKIRDKVLAAVENHRIDLSKIDDEKTLQYIAGFKRYSTERVMKSLVGEFTQNEKWSVKGNLMGECWYKDCCVSEHTDNLRCGKPEVEGGDSKEYIPTRYPLDGWGGVGGNCGNDNTGGRSDRFTAGVAFLDGKTPSPVMVRGWYGRTVVAAWTFTNGALKHTWTFDSAAPGWEAYSGMGNHSVTVADFDGDGCDEICVGAMTVDHDGKGLFTTGLRHGDALHAGRFIPSRQGMQVFGVHENEGDNEIVKRTPAVAMFDGATGEIIWQDGLGQDAGRGVAADIDPRYDGAECWCNIGGLRRGDTGEIISNRKPDSCNFTIYWDADPLAELLDHVSISKWNWNAESTDLLLKAEGVVSNNGTKGNPCLSGDILGDWREEVIWPSEDQTELRIYSTTIPAVDRRATWMNDRQYRLAIAWQNVAYNQPPHPSF